MTGDDGMTEDKLAEDGQNGVVIDWDGSVAAWVADVEADILRLMESDPRFVNVGALASRFRDRAALWKGSGADGARPKHHVHALIEDGNEVATAWALLERMEAGDTLAYEPRLADTEQSLDFMVRRADGSRLWFEVKSVRPGWDDSDESWQRYEMIAAEFPDNAGLVVDRRWGGAALSGQAIKTRWSFIRQTIEVERKAALLAPEQHGPVRLVLCSSGSWNADDLEDFADYYRTGRFRGDDWSRNAVARFMSDQSLAFAGTLAGFCFLQRPQDEVRPRHFLIDMRGPTIGSDPIPFW